MDQYFEHLNNIAITICDAEGNVLDMNQHSADVNSHGHKIIGNNLMDCHPEPARTKLRGLLFSELPCHVGGLYNRRQVLYVHAEHIAELCAPAPGLSPGIVKEG